MSSGDRLGLVVERWEVGGERSWYGRGPAEAEPGWGWPAAAVPWKKCTRGEGPCCALLVDDAALWLYVLGVRAAIHNGWSEPTEPEPADPGASAAAAGGDGGDAGAAAAAAAAGGGGGGAAAGVLRAGGGPPACIRTRHRR